MECIVTWISGLCYFGNEYLANFWLQEGLLGKDTVPDKVTGRACMTAAVHPPQYVLDKISYAEISKSFKQHTFDHGTNTSS